MSHFDSSFPYALNSSLNHEVMGSDIHYSFTHHEHGQLNMTIVHHNYGFGVTPEDGFKLLFLTEIDGYDEPICEGHNVP